MYWCILWFLCVKWNSTHTLQIKNKHNKAKKITLNINVASVYKHQCKIIKRFNISSHDCFFNWTVAFFVCLLFLILGLPKTRHLSNNIFVYIRCSLYSCVTSQSVYRYASIMYLKLFWFGFLFLDMYWHITEPKSWNFSFFYLCLDWLSR